MAAWTKLDCRLCASEATFVRAVCARLRFVLTTLFEESIEVRRELLIPYDRSTPTFAPRLSPRSATVPLDISFCRFERRDCIERIELVKALDIEKVEIVVLMEGAQGSEGGFIAVKSVV